MKLALAVLADAAVANPIDGKMYILGGGFDTLAVQQFPAQHAALALALRVLVAPSECGRPHKLEVQAVDADGRPFQPPFTVDVTPPKNAIDTGLPTPIQLVETFQQLQFAGPAEYAFNVLIDGSEVASLPLRVIKAPPGMAGLRPAA
jgi:hypothetical protein